jgi:hypothetical protein
MALLSSMPSHGSDDEGIKQAYHCGGRTGDGGGDLKCVVPGTLVWWHASQRRAGRRRRSREVIRGWLISVVRLLFVDRTDGFSRWSSGCRGPSWRGPCLARAKRKRTTKVEEEGETRSFFLSSIEITTRKAIVVHRTLEMIRAQEKKRCENVRRPDRIKVFSTCVACTSWVWH